MSMVSFLTAAVLMISPAGPADPLPRATVEQGVVVGRETEGVRSFKGVPYAQPPVGDLRWRSPTGGWA